MDVLGVDHLEAKAKLLAHLALPFLAQTRRAHHQNLLCLVPQHQLLRDQTRFYGLGQPDIVGNQQADPRHSERFDQRQELIILNINASSERGLECRGIS